MYTLKMVKPGVGGNCTDGYRGSYVECVKLARRLYRRLGQVSTLLRPDGSDVRRPTVRLPLP